MSRADQLPEISIRDLSRRTGEVVDRVLRGERLVVARHGRPVATLQPLDGFVFQPFEGREKDVTGSPLGDVTAEIEKLTEIQRRLLVDGVRFDHIHPTWLSSRFDLGEIRRDLKDLRLRSLARRTSRGWVLSGRGMMLREALLAEAGISEESTWRLHPSAD